MHRQNGPYCKCVRFEKCFFIQLHTTGISFHRGFCYKYRNNQVDTSHWGYAPKCDAHCNFLRMFEIVYVSFLYLHIISECSCTTKVAKYRSYYNLRIPSNKTWFEKGKVNERSSRITSLRWRNGIQWLGSIAVRFAVSYIDKKLWTQCHKY